MSSPAVKDLVRASEYTPKHRGVHFYARINEQSTVLPHTDSDEMWDIPHTVIYPISNDVYRSGSNFGVFSAIVPSQSSLSGKVSASQDAKMSVVHVFSKNVYDRKPGAAPGVNLLFYFKLADSVGEKNMEKLSAWQEKICKKYQKPIERVMQKMAYGESLDERDVQILDNICCPQKAAPHFIV